MPIVWELKNGKEGETYKVKLNPLMSGGEYQYFLFIEVKSKDSDAVTWRGTSEPILSTGHVAYQENIYMFIMAAIGGAILGRLL
jgi:ABC-type lipoprotein release transport system permease subunit